MKQFLIFCLTIFNVAISNELPMLYNQNYATPSSAYEEELVAHVKMSLEKALKLESKLTGTPFIKDEESKNWKIAIPFHHVLNNLCALEGASHLHIGLLRGGSFIAALYGNQSMLRDQIGVDWFHEYPEKRFYHNCNKYLERSKYQIINAECFHVDKTLFKNPIDIYCYDADHSLKAQEKAFTYYNDIFADVFIAVVDDWKCEWVRAPTFKAFKKLGYWILFEDIIPEAYGNGQYIAVIRKSK